MEKEFDLLIETMKKLDGFTIIDTSVEATWIHFKLTSEASLVYISNTINDVKEQFPCSLLVLTNQDDPDKFTYQLVIEAEDKEATVNILIKKFATLLDAAGDARRAKHKELGLPDLSLVTIRQMAMELKQRHNLTFALVWIEHNERDNIAIEGSGNPTQLVGLLSRGTHMAIEWADKNIKFYRPKDEE
jgi:uncharacterized protein YlxP (DUF503 family)